MAKVPITVKGINRITDNLVDAGISGLNKFVKAAREDRVESDYNYSAVQELSGKYGVDSDGGIGFLFQTPTIGGTPTGGSADVGYDFANEGIADVRLTVTISIFAKDFRPEATGGTVTPITNRPNPPR